jgi:hypothetical protein
LRRSNEVPIYRDENEIDEYIKKTMFEERVAAINAGRVGLGQPNRPQQFSQPFINKQGTPRQAHIGEVTVQAMMENEIFNAPVQTLRDMWMIKYPGWVPSDAKKDEDYCYIQAVLAREKQFDEWGSVYDSVGGGNKLMIRLKRVNEEVK